MSENVSFRNKTYHHILISLSTLLVFASLFIFRHIDNNRLTNWNWAFSGIDVSFIFLLLLAGIVVAYFISRLSFLEDHPRSSLMLLSFLICLPFWKEPEVVVDASRYFTQAKHLKEYGIYYFLSEWGHDINAWTDLPLLPFVYGVFFKFFGENRVIIQLFNSLLFSTTILFTYLTGKVLWNKTLGYSAGLLLLGMPYVLTQPPLMLVDIATMCFLAFAVYAFIMAVKKGGVWIVISSIGIFLAVFSKYSTWMLLSVLVVIFVVYIFQNTDHRTQITDGQHTKASGFRICFQRGLFTAIITLLLSGIIIFLKFDVIAEQINLLMTYQKPALKGWSENFISTFFYQIHPFITLAAICSVYAAWKKRDMKYAIIFWLVLIIMVLQIKRIRYILPMFPMITLMAAYGFQLLKNEQIRRFAVLSAVIPSLVIALFVYLPFLKQMSSANLMHAGAYLDSIKSSDVEVITLPSDQSSINPSVSVPILDYFTEKNIYYDYQRTYLPDNVNMLPLRFTWTYENPAYYDADFIISKQENMPLVVITTGQEGEYPEDIHNRIKHYSKVAEFNIFFPL